MYTYKEKRVQRQTDVTLAPIEEHADGTATLTIKNLSHRFDDWGQAFRVWMWALNFNERERRIEKLRKSP